MRAAEVFFGCGILYCLSDSSEIKKSQRPYGKFYRNIGSKALDKLFNLNHCFLLRT